VGDEFQGSHSELFSFIHKILSVGGTAKMVSHNIARITSLPSGKTSK